MPPDARAGRSRLHRLIRAIHDPPTHNRRHHFSGQLRSVKWRVVRPGVRLRGFKSPALLRIEDRDIGMTAAGERSAASQREHPRRTRGEELDNPAERKFLLAMQVGDRQAQSGFQSGDAKRGALELDNLFMRRVRGVVGGDRVDGSVRQRDQDGLAVRLPNAAADSF